MSMHGHYRKIRASLADALHRHPDLVEHVVLYDAEDAGDPRLRGVPSPVAAMLQSLPPEMRAKVAGELASPSNPMMQALVAQMADANVAYATLTNSAAKALETHGIATADIGPTLDIGKAWHGLHFLLAGTPREPTEPPGNAVLGGLELGPDLAYGPARLMAASEVVRTAPALEKLRSEDLRGRFDPAAMKEAKIYGGHWDDPRELEWLLDAFARVRDQYVDAATQGDAILLWLT